MRRLIVLLVLIIPLATGATFMHGTREILRVELRNGRLEVTHLHRSGATYMVIPPREAPGELFKVVYGCVDGQVAAVDTIQGQHITRRAQPERFVFPESE